MHIDDLIQTCLESAQATAKGHMTVSRAREVHRIAHTGVKAIEAELRGQIEKYRQHNVRWLSKRPTKEKEKPVVIKNAVVEKATFKKVSNKRG